MFQTGLTITEGGGDWKHPPVSRRHGVLCAKDDKALWDVSDFDTQLADRIDAELKRTLHDLVVWSVSQDRAGELAEIVPVHEAAVMDLRGQIEKQRKAGKSVEKKLVAKKKLFSGCFEDDALDSERRLAEKMLADIERQVERGQEKIVDMERTIEQHEAFCAQLAGLIAGLRQVQRPPLPNWLTGA